MPSFLEVPDPSLSANALPAHSHEVKSPDFTPLRGVSELLALALQVVDDRGQKPRRLPTRHGAVIEGKRQREQLMDLDPLAHGAWGAELAARAQDRDGGRQHHRRG